MEDNGDRVNMDAQMQIDSTTIKLVEQYASCDRRSDEINDERATIRKNAEKLGYTSAEFQEVVKRSKKMSKTERDVYEEHVNRIIGVVEGRQAELWPKQAEKQKAREDRKQTKAAADAKSDANPRSDPKRGGAGKVPVPAADAAEQASGAAALEAGLPETRKAQSQIVAEKLEAAKLN